MAHLVQLSPLPLAGSTLCGPEWRCIPVDIDLHALWVTDELFETTQAA